MTEKEVKKEALTSLNSSIFDELSVEQLETRLETDPLAVGQFIQLTSATEDMLNTDFCCYQTICNEIFG